MKEIQVWNYDDADIRTVENDNEIWWVLADVCAILELSNPRIVAERLDEDERRKFDLPRQGGTWFINESGLYSVIIRSDKPQAKPFRRWVTHEVLPSIRKTGSYNAPKARSDEIDRLSRRIDALEKESLLRRVEALESVQDSSDCDSVYYKAVEKLPPHIRAALNTMIDNGRHTIGHMLDFLEDNHIWIPHSVLRGYIRKRKT